MDRDIEKIKSVLDRIAQDNSAEGRELLYFDHDDSNVFGFLDALDIRSADTVESRYDLHLENKKNPIFISVDIQFIIQMIEYADPKIWGGQKIVVNEIGQLIKQIEEFDEIEEARKAALTELRRAEIEREGVLIYIYRNLDLGAMSEDDYGEIIAAARMLVSAMAENDRKAKKL
jgi:hypothetical protein